MAALLGGGSSSGLINDGGGLSQGPCGRLRLPSFGGWWAGGLVRGRAPCRVFRGIRALAYHTPALPHPLPASCHAIIQLEDWVQVHCCWTVFAVLRTLLRGRAARAVAQPALALSVCALRHRASAMRIGDGLGGHSHSAGELVLAAASYQQVYTCQWWVGTY